MSIQVVWRRKHDTQRSQFVELNEFEVDAKMSDVFARESMFYSKNGETYDKKLSQIELVEVKDGFQTTLVSVQIDLAPMVGKKDHRETLKLYDDLMMGLQLEVEWTIQPLTGDNKGLVVRQKSFANMAADGEDGE